MDTGPIIMQAAVDNQQIPAKLYEYLRMGRPILGLTDASGDTAELMRKAGLDTIVGLDDRRALEGSLLCFVERVRACTAPVPDRNYVRGLSRRHRAIELAAIFNEVSV